MEADVVVVGGGPAGLATALHARRAGLSAIVLDRARPPVDKPCGEGLMPDGVALLEGLGVELPGEEWRHPFRGIRYLTEDPGLEDDDLLVAEGRFPGGATGRGVRRTALHRAMVERAEAAGVRLLWGERATVLVGLERGGPPVGVRTASDRTHLGRWLVGADGLGSAVRRWARLGDDGANRSSGVPEGARFGVRRHYRVAPWTDLVEVYWGEGCEAYVTPVGRETVGVAMLWRPDQEEGAGFDDLLARFPRLRAHLAGAQPASADLGCGPLRRPLHGGARSVARGRVALVGDASGYLDAITGEGLSLAFHQARALAAAIAHSERADPEARQTSPLSGYERAHRRLRRLPELLIRLLLFAERRPPLRLRLIRALADDPGLFDRLLALHARMVPAVSPAAPYLNGLATAVRLARRLASAGP